MLRILRTSSQYSPCSLTFQYRTGERPCLRNHTKQLHTSHRLCKKFNEELYETVSVYDSTGANLIVETELLVLQKFCQKFHRFYCEQMTSNTPKDNTKPKCYILKEKEQKSSEPLKEKERKSDEPNVKQVKFSNKSHKDITKLNRIVENLVNHGVVSVQYGKNVPEGLSAVICEYSTFSKLPADCSSIRAKPITTDMIRSLIQLVRDAEKEHLENVQGMLTNMKSSE